MVLFALALLSGGGPLDGFVKVPAGRYEVGKAGRLDNYRRIVRLKAFEIAKTETTNAQFAAFVEATGYVTD
ncbi:MAG TPA: SUMF1/EgtB/PvdO family nonheme iron enzyme, partial [Fimbriimonadaceae bacterium]|nr:SUMF1/EgtB/PvdO family nonheme iron enzyme [Fimbriimonadaceae bacterium]